MSFPNTIDTIVSGAEQPGKFATFLDGTDRYQIQVVTSSGQFNAYKSTDAGVTWSLVGSGPVGLPASSGTTIPYTVVQVDAVTLKMFYLDAGAGGFFAVTTFTMGAVPAWSGVATASLLVPLTPGEGGAGLAQISAGFRQGSNTVLVFAASAQITGLGDVAHTITEMSVYSVGGDFFTAPVPMGFADYGEITSWDTMPCGVAVGPSGLATVFMQQVSRSGPGDPQTASFAADDTFTAPLDMDPAVETLIGCYGAGGGGGGDVAFGPGGGGGGGGFVSGHALLTPGTSYPVTVGVGGAVRADGAGPTVFEGVTAGPGHAGLDNGIGGAGGAGSEAGGHGGSVGINTGGGGGASGSPSGVGGVGNAGDTVGVFGGAGGTAADTTGGDGGAGGNRGGANPPNHGSPGAGPGGGGGGQGSSDDGANQGTGADGAVRLAWVSVRATNPCRLFQQAVLPDNTLGTLQEITQGSFPSRPKGSTPVPISFDLAIRGAAVAITFTGAGSTGGRNQIAVGRGVSADPISFAFQDFSSGNGGNGTDSCPCVAAGAGVLYCCYIAAPDGGPMSFLYRADFGTGFGPSVLIGSLPLPDVREFGRLQCSVLVTLPEITFGTPTQASLPITVAA